MMSLRTNFTQFFGILIVEFEQVDTKWGGNTSDFKVWNVKIFLQKVHQLVLALIMQVVTEGFKASSSQLKNQFCLICFKLLQLKAANYFCKKAPSLIFDWILNTSQ